MLPERVHLSQNYPNPFNPVTTIEYSIPKACSVSLTIFNSQGEKITSLVDQENQAAGQYKVKWDAHRVASGVYFYRLTAGHDSQIGKMILIR